VAVPEVRRGLQVGAVRLGSETGKPIAQVARDLRVNAGTLGNWVTAAGGPATAGRPLTEDERAELARLRKENAEQRMQRDVLKRSVAPGWTRRWAGSGGRVHRRPEGGPRRAARTACRALGVSPAWF
jgi:transposase